MGLMRETMASLIALEPLVESAIRSTALLAIAALVALALRRTPAAMRHLVWTLALLGCVAMPLASRVVPGWSLPALPAWQSRSETPPRVDANPAPATMASPAPTQQGRASQAASVSAPLDGTPRASIAWRPSIADAVRMSPILWLAGVVLIVGRHLLGWASLSRVARRAPTMTDHAWQVALARHGVTLGLARLPALRVSPRITVPIVCGALRPTILLPIEAREWPRERRDAVLLHELAHVRRFDLITARVTQLASTLYWFNPFVWLAARCQRAEAERACDDQVLDAGGRASAYASDLLEIARAIGRRDHLDAAALAMARRSQLEGRLLAILDPKLPRGAAGRIAISLSVLVAVGSIGVLAAVRPVQSRPAPKVEMPALVPLTDLLQVKHPNQGTARRAAAAPSPFVAAAATAKPAEGPRASGSSDKPPGKGSSHWSITDNGKGEVRSGSWNHRDSRGSFKSKGTIRYSNDLDDIESISPGGYVEIEDRRDQKWHKATLLGRSGGIERSYWVDGTEHPWDDAARAWLANFLIDLDHSSGIFVEQRFPRLMNEGGPTRVLREVSNMTSDYGRSIYLRKLLADNADELTMRRAVTQAGREIDSDYELARTLMTAAEKHALEDATTRAAFLEATNTLQSDYEHSRVLMVLVQRRDLSPGLVAGVIESASRMESDYEQAQVMIALAEQGHVKPPLQPGFIRAAYSFDSDYERGRVLAALLDRGRLADVHMGEILLASARFQSDYERANVLIRLAESVSMGEAERAAFVESTKGLSSDYERQRALAALGNTSKR
jgi:beta-lactamase regulating signal transducer with metallopeptidase domain